MSFKMFIESKDYEFFGTCITTVDDIEYWDATEMAQYIENSSKLSSIEFLDLAQLNDLKIITKVNKNLKNFEAGIGEDKQIIWFYDLKDDIHYFF